MLLLFLNNGSLAFAPFFLLHRFLFYLAENLETDQIRCFPPSGLEILVRPAPAIARLANLREGFSHETRINGWIQCSIDAGDTTIWQY